MFKRRSAGFIISLVFAFISFFPVIVPAQTVPFQTIDKGEISCYRYNDITFSGADMVINDQKTWAWFWQKHLECIQTFAPVPLPRVDFRKEMVLAIILGHQTSGGGPGVEINSIEKIPADISSRITGVKAFVKENESPGMLTVITNPFHIVKLMKSSSVVFDHEPMEKPCRDNADCSITDFCEKPDGQCEQSGVCKVRPAVCPMFYAPVCGCDMKTYENPCVANAYGTSILYMGPCK